MNRRSFLQSILAAGVAPYLPRAESMMPLARPRQFVPSAALEESLLASYSLFENADRNYIDCTALLSEAKEYMRGLITYSYTADVELVGSRVMTPRNLLVDGLPLDLSCVRSVDQSFPENRILIQGLPLDEYGNRVPRFTYRDSGWKEKT